MSIYGIYIGSLKERWSRYYVRTLLFVTMISWGVLLTGRIVECIMSERMLVTNPGAPPWTRIGRWYGASVPFRRSSVVIL